MSNHFMHSRRAARPARWTGFVTVAAAIALVAPAAHAQRAPIPTPPELRMQWYDRHEQMLEQSRFSGLEWQWLGPTNNGGRVTDVAVVQPRGESYAIYIATASGGVWKTTNEGVSWQPIFEHGPSTSIGDVTLAPSNQDIVWVGTGEANIFRSSMAGAGVFKSTDGGATWQHMGLVGTHTIPRIIIHPTDPEIVWVAASGHEWTDNEERGVYKTTDGGGTWTKVLYVNEKTGAIDLVIDPSNPNTLYASTWQRVRRKWNDPRVDPGSTGSGIWKSTDGGATWNQINEGLPAARYRGRIGIDIARSSPNTLYAFVDNYEIARAAEPGETNAYGMPAADVIRGATVYRTDNGGAQWRQVSQTDSYMEGISNTYGWVFGQIRVDPTNPDKIYLHGVQFHVSEDGGRTFRRIGGMHADHHAMWIDPRNPDYLVNGNDGGAYVSYDGGESWRSFTDEIPVVQFFNVGHDMDDPFRVYGSVQDHGSRRGMVDLSRGRNDIPAVSWEGAPGGEGSTHAVDPTDPNIVYSAGFYGSISRTNLATGESGGRLPDPPEGELPYRGQWLAPFIISPHNPRVIYHGMNYLFRSMNRGENWERISPDLTHNDRDRLGDIPYQTIFSISESPFTFGLIYVGTDDGRVWLTRDSGRNWTEITRGLVPGKFIAEIVASKYDSATVYLAQNGKREDDFAPYVWVSTDHGRSWRDLAAGIPIGPVNVVKEDPKNPNVLYVGTDISVYVSTDRGASWSALSSELPSTFVSDMIVHPRDDIAVISTHGRGMYAVDVRPIQRLTAEVMASPAAVLEQDVMRLPATRPMSLYYWSAQSGPVTLTVRNPSGTVLAELQEEASRGVNVVDWSIGGGRGGRGGRGGGGFGRGGRGGGAAALVPGLYQLELRAGAATATGTLRVEG